MNGQTVEALWQKIMSAALLGTARQPFVVPKAEGALGALLSQLDDSDPEGALLSAAAILSYARRSGAVPTPLGRALPPPCPRDPQPAMSAAAAELLLSFDVKRPYLLEEWLLLAFAHGKRVPESFAPELLTLSEQIQPALGALVAGVRGRWLAMQLGKWTYAAFQLDDDSAWRTGAFVTRKTFLCAMRLLDPERARQLLAEAWDREPAQQRADLLDALIHNLSEADLPFLSQAAQVDRALSVRERAASLIERLRQVPPSPEQREAEASLLFSKRTWRAEELALIGRCEHSWSLAFSQRFVAHIEPLLRSAMTPDGMRWQDSSFPAHFEPLLTRLHPEALASALAALESVVPASVITEHIAQWRTVAVWQAIVQWQTIVRLRAAIHAAFDAAEP
ncbi:MAG: hypothetical protein J7551_09265 [Chloroflexi bacterium]|nr:hypothetical protein [Chloroflexota bacterium]